MQIKLAECNENMTYEDNVMTVQYVPLTPENEGEPSFVESCDISLNKDIQVGAGLFETVMLLHLFFHALN